jgi:ubiquitin carboxyl-terminal hydrolase 8
MLLNALHAELNVRHGNNESLVLQPDSSLGLFAQASSQWAVVNHCNASAVSDVTSLQLCSTVRCATCKSASNSFETTNQLRVDLPKARTRDSFGRPTRGRGTEPVSLEECFRAFTQREKLSGREQWLCPVCREKREAVKQVSLVRAPHVLLVHLNRFDAHNSDQKHGRLVQLCAELDLAPYTTAAVATDENATDAPTANTQLKYELMAVVNHTRTRLGAKHYTSFCKTKVDARAAYPLSYSAYSSSLSHSHTSRCTQAEQDGWMLYDDALVTPASQKQVLKPSAEAYLLLFERKR